MRLRSSLVLCLALLTSGVLLAQPPKAKKPRPGKVKGAKPASQPVAPEAATPLAATDAEATPTAAGLEFFEKKIRPVLVDKCYSCHAAGAKKIEGGLVLDTREGIRRGGSSGPAVVPGSVEDSLLMEAIRFEGLEMPPDQQLSDEVIADFRRWIVMGAPDPREGGGPVVRRTIDFTEGRRHWAFQPPVDHSAPEVRDSAWPRTDVDRFVLARLEQEQLHPVADAEKADLLRRVSFDLIGLPPTPEEIEAFLADTSSEAFERQVDRLLESPQFGERWGRHWLDVARFGESNGRERNFLYPQAWRYRDYVVAAVNSDLPYDQFLREQIAGDLLPEGPRTEQQRIATGFLAIGPKSLNERNMAIFTMDLVDDQVDTTTRAVMGLTVSCARCHDHKFDPIPTAEYYSMAGIFVSTKTFYGTGGNGNRQPSRLLTLSGSPANDDSASEGSAAPQRPAQPVVLQQAAGDAGTPKQPRDPEKIAQLRQQIAELAKVVRDPGTAADQRKMLQRRLKKLREELVEAGGAPAVAPAAAPKRAQRRAEAAGAEDSSDAVRFMGVVDGTPTDCHILIRGEVDDRGDEVPRGYLTILSPDQPPRVTSGSGRLELAQWLTSASNPLTARVAVNRVWQHLFGEGLVESVDNFGMSGEAPSHPELLDHLAVEFVADGWSLKRLVRRLVLSRTYQLSSQHDDAAYDRDPLNRWLWRSSIRRLEAEAIRDAMLLASGQLQLDPPGGSPLATLSDSAEYGRGVALDADGKRDRHRSLYLPIVRNAPPASLAIFDFAEPSILVARREVTTVPAQALFLLNNEFVLEQSDALAARLLAQSELDDAGRVRLGYLLTAGRAPTDSERDRCLAFVAEVLTAEPAGSNTEREASVRQAWSLLAQAWFASGEFRYVR